MVAVDHGTAELCADLVKLVAEVRHLIGAVLVARDDLVYRVDHYCYVVLFLRSAYELWCKLIHWHTASSQVPDVYFAEVVGLDLHRCVHVFKTVQAACSVIYDWLGRFGYAGDVSQDDRVTLSAMQQIAHDKLQSASYTLMMQDIDKAKAAVRARTAWRIEGTFREFPKLPPLNLWFDYPIHRADEDEVLKDAGYEGDDNSSHSFKNSRGKGQKARIKQAKEDKVAAMNDFEIAFASAEVDGVVAISDLAKTVGIKSATLKKRFGNGQQSDDEYKELYELFYGDNKKAYLKRKENK